MNILKIYKTQLTPARNALLDDIEGYLEAIERKSLLSYTGKDQLTYTETDFQFTKPDLDLTIKINVPKNNNNLFDSIGNYARIEQRQNNGETSIWYYFIIKSKWTALATLELQLSLDTVNTFSSYLLDENNWSEKTSIIRQHKDRFKQIELGNYVKNIDKIGEEISVPYSIKTNDIIIEEPNSTGTPEWYLVYNTNQAVVGEGDASASTNTVQCEVYPRTPVLYSQTASQNQSVFSRSVSDFENNKIYGIVNGGVSFTNIDIIPGYAKKGVTGEIGLEDTIGVDGEDYWTKEKLEFFPTLTVSGSINIGDTFTRNGTTYTCYSIAWYKNTDITGSGINLPVGLFKTEGSDKIYYAVYLNKINDTVVNRWLFRGVVVHFDAWVHWVIQCFTEQIPLLSAFVDTFAGQRSVQSLEDTSRIDTDYFNPEQADTNWARNPLYFEGGELNFTEETTGIYAIKYANNTPTNAQFLSGDLYYSNGEAGISATLKPYTELNTSAPTLIKVIASPYCPVKIDTNIGENGEYYSQFESLIPTDIEGSKVILKYEDLTSSFGKYLNTTTFDYSAPDSLLDFYYEDNLNDKDINNETKLLHSDFYKPTFVYDNVTKVIRREDLISNDKTVQVKPWFQPTNTFSSTMLFKFDFENAVYNQITDWDTVLISTRNNELPIFNNDYINYLRFGYGAEKETLEASADAQRHGAWTNAIISTAGSTISGAAKGGAPGAVLGAATGLAKSAASLITTETNIANAQRSLAAKVEQKQNSAATVSSGNSAVDLMTTYTGNRLHLMTYDTVDILKEAIYDKFYYCGYSSPVQAKPNLNNRLVFNFVQCDPIFIDEATNTYNYYVEDIKERFRAGVTVYHDVKDYIQKVKPGELIPRYDELVYNWKQTYENWEKFDRVLPADFKVETDNYNFNIVLNETLTNEYTKKFIPNANNTFRYKVTYKLPGSIVESDYPYADATDRANGYTLETNFSLQAISNVTNGIIITVRLIDTAEMWLASEGKILTVNQYVTQQETPTVPYFKRNRVVSQGQTYWLWSSGNVSIATLNEYPIPGGDKYDVRILGTNQYVMTLSNFKIANINAFNN